MANLHRMMVDLEKLFALLDRRVDQVERAGRTNQEAPDDVVRAVEVATRTITLLGDMILPALEKSIADAKRPTDVGRFTLQAINHCFRTGRPVPKSIQKSFERIYAKQGTYKSWDRAFGQPRKGAKHLTSLGDIERLVLVAKEQPTAYRQRPLRDDWPRVRCWRQYKGQGTLFPSQGRKNTPIIRRYSPAPS